MKVRAKVLETMSRHWPFANGSGRLLDRYARDVDTGEGRRVVRTSDGFDMAVLADDHIGRHLILSGKFDRSLPKVLLDFAETGDRCADIGANIGYVASILLKHIPDSHVLCVEPQPGIVSLLEENLARFPHDRWTLLPVALSDSDTDGFLRLDRVNRGASSLVTTSDDETVSVPLRRADEVLGTCERLDLLKMDVEGHEETIFRAARDVLERLQPRAMLYEDQTGNSRPGGSIGQLLDTAGYRVFGIAKSLTATRLSPVTGENAGTFNDFVAVSRTRALPRRATERHAL